MTENYKRLYFMILFALVFYVVGAGFVQSFVNYPTWHLVGAAEFKAYHNEMSPLIMKFMVLPWLAEILLTILLLRLRPRAVPRRAVAVALALNAVSVVSTALIQIPIQIQLGDSGLSLELLNQLLETDLIRVAAGVLKALLYLWMMSLVVRHPNLTAPRGVQFSTLEGGT